MHYLFGFSGRINRAKMWLFLLVTMAWEIVIFVIAAFGLRWSHYLQAMQAFAKAGRPFAPAPQPFPDPITGNGWIAVGIIALLLLLYLVAYFAVFVKRLHDRGKGVVWLVPYLVLPWILEAFVWMAGPMQGGWPQHLFVGQIGIARGVVYSICIMVAIWVFIDLYCVRGTKGENRFGPDPLAK